MSHASRRIDVDDIRDLLTDRAADLTQRLLGEPNPDLSSKRELRFGNRGSLAVVITGKKAGSFFDHEAAQGGDMLGLIQRERSCGFADALKFARDFCGSAIVRTKRPHKVNGKQQPSAGKIVAAYPYHDEAGAVLFEVVRFDPKDFRQRKPNGAGGWSWSVKGVKQVPYRLRGLIDNRDRVIVIVEGERDADNLWKLGIPATCNAGGAGNWKPSLNEFFHDADIVVIPDNDPQKRHPKTDEPMFHRDGRPILPGQDHAQMVAKSLSEVARRVRVLELWKHWPDMPLKGDVSDWIENGGTPEALYELIDKTPDWSPPDEHDTEAEQAEPEDDGSEFAIEIVRLAKLPAIKYEQERKAAAEALGCRASVLDRLVQDERARLGGDDGMQGRAISFSEPEAWPEAVDGAALFDEISEAIGSHIVMPATSRDACALWAAHTYLTGATMISPRLAITSPTRGCGKTTALDVLSQLVLRPLPSANVSASAIFRVVEGFHPTLMIDEADSFLKDNEELRGVLNSGHRKGGAVLRNVGDDHEPRSFSTYGACSIALIGQLPPTLTDRSVPITLTRRKRGEDIKPFRLDRVEHLVVLARRLARWTADNAVAIAATEPVMPAGIYNRAEDNWRPLLAIATVAGGQWLARGQAAALKSVASDIDDASLLELLLGDIREIFAKRKANKVEPVDRIPSTVLAEALAELEGRPWGEYGRSEKPITPGKLARLLKPLVIAPENIRIDDKVPKGYVLERFTEAFARYLSPDGSSEPPQRYNADETGTSELFQSATAGTGVADRKSKKPNNDGHCSGVADQKGGVEEKSPNVTYFGVEPFGPCVQCGGVDGVVHHVRDNRHLGRPATSLHEACVADWWAARQEGDGGDGNGAAICAHCGRPGGNEVFFSDGLTARLHRECEELYRRVLDGDE